MLGKLLINFLVPVVVFTSITQFSEAVSDTKVFIFSASIFLFSFIISILFSKGLKLGEGRAGPFILASVNPNGFYLPFPIVYALYRIPLRVGPFVVHPEKHPGPVARFGPACAYIYAHDCV